MHDDGDGDDVALAQEAWLAHAHDDVLAHDDSVECSTRFGIRRDGANSGTPGGERVWEGQGDARMAGGVGVYVGLPEGGIGKVLADARCAIDAWFYLRQLRVEATLGKQHRPLARLAGEVIVERIFYVRVGLALRIKCIENIAARIRFDRVDRLVDDAEAEIRRDRRACGVVRSYVVGSALLRLECLRRGCDRQLQLLLSRRNGDIALALIDFFVVEEDDVNRQIGLRVLSDGKVEVQYLAGAVQNLAKLDGISAGGDERMKAIDLSDNREMRSIAGSVALLVRDETNLLIGVISEVLRLRAVDPEPAYVFYRALLWSDGCRVNIEGARHVDGHLHYDGAVSAGSCIGVASG